MCFNVFHRGYALASRLYILFFDLQLLMAALPDLQLLNGEKPSAEAREEALTLVSEVFGEGDDDDDGDSVVDDDEDDEEEDDSTGIDANDDDDDDNDDVDDLELAEAEAFLRDRRDMLDLVNAGRDDLNELLRQLNNGESKKNYGDDDGEERLGQLLVRESRERRGYGGASTNDSAPTKTQDNK
jgi:hypothetical protein